MVPIMGRAAIIVLRLLLKRVILTHRVHPIILDVLVAILFALVIESWMITNPPSEASFKELVTEVSNAVQGEIEHGSGGVSGKDGKFTFTLWPDGKYTGYHDGKEWVGTWKLIKDEKSVAVTEWKSRGPNHAKFGKSYPRSIDLTEDELNVLGELPCSGSRRSVDKFDRKK